MKKGLFIVILIIGCGLYFVVGNRIGYNQGYKDSHMHLNNLHNTYDELALNTSCGNISNYVTGNFISDVIDLKKEAHQCNNNLSDDGFSLYGVNYLKSCSDIHIDCEDISFMIDCLAREYNISCEYYTYVAVNRDAHRGIDCNVSGQLFQLY